ncbi:30S ribosomal protein S4 [Clostridia bacterium]|nr:30S ribosomal protein S4 [Clostridia bacterium]
MAVSREPILKRCRYLGISPAVLGYSKSSNRKKDTNTRKKLSEYGMQLKEKQKLKFIYGVLEKQFYHYFELATKMEGKAGDNLITCLETRLDNIAFRMGIATTRRDAREIVTHGHIYVNGSRVDIPSYRVKKGDVVTLADKAKSITKFKDALESSRVSPSWLTVNKEAFKATIERLPSIEDVDYPVEAHLIVELYSK